MKKFFKTTGAILGVFFSPFCLCSPNGMSAPTVFMGDIRGSTFVTVSEPPYTTWTELTQSKITRLDGPFLFLYNDRVFAVGRFQPDLGIGGPLSPQGSALARRRTSIYEVRGNGLVYLTDLPSDCETSYVGLVIDGNYAYASYYTSPIDLDYGWILGMFSPTSVRMAQIDLRAMEALVDQTDAKCFCKSKQTF